MYMGFVRQTEIHTAEPVWTQTLEEKSFAPGSIEIENYFLG
jgi:hypothetical protein